MTRPARDAKSLTRQPRVAVPILATLLLGATVLGSPGRALATQLVLSAFTGPSNGIAEATSNSWSVSGNTAAGESGVPAMVDGPDPDTDVDRLRLTSTGEAQTGYALYDVAQTTSSGLDVTFNLAMNGYGGNGCPTNPPDNYNYLSTGGLEPNSSNTCQADGFVFYLKSGSDTQTGGDSLGRPGGSLGYSPLYGSAGLSGALLGVGFDAFGNFYQQPFGGGDCVDDPSNTSTYARQSLIVRGAQGDSRTVGYCRVVTSADTSVDGRNRGVDLSAYSSLFTSDGVAVRITIDPSDTSGGRTYGTGSVFITSVDATTWSGVSAATTFELPQKLNAAPTFKFGFVAGTGGGAMNTEIWKAQVSSLRAVPDPVITTSGPFCASTVSPFHQRLASTEGVAPYTYSVSDGSLPPGLGLSSGGLISGTPTASGTYSVQISSADSSSETADAHATYVFNVLDSGCDSRIAWDISGAQPQLPTSVALDGSCSAGSYAQATDGHFRIATFTAPASGDAVCSWSPPAGVTYVEALVVGGGGGGGFDAGGGGGGGAVVLHSALPVSGSIGVTVGAGGAGSSSAAPWGAKAGDAGRPSEVISGDVDLYAAPGYGGAGCYWTGYLCSYFDMGNFGGVGGSASGGTLNLSGGNGGNGVWATTTGEDRDPPQSGAAGAAMQTGLELQTYGCGGGGSGAGLTAGSAGCATAGSGLSGEGSAPDADPGFGGGGGGGNAGPGGSGGSGIVILRYSAQQGTNDPAVGVTAGITGQHTLSSHGTFIRQVATWTEESGCDSHWSSKGESVSTGSDTTSLTRGYCYRWTFDQGLDANGMAPADSAGFRPVVNLTSPAIVVVPEVNIVAPTSLPADPRSTTLAGLSIHISGASSVLLCLDQAASSSLTGAGEVAAHPSITFDTAQVGSAEATVNGVAITGDTTHAFSASGSTSQVVALAGELTIGRTLGFGGQVPILIRAIPVYAGMQSTCVATGGQVGPHASGAAVTTVTPLLLSGQYGTTLHIGR